MSRQQRRRQNLDLLRSITAGKKIIKAWDGHNILWKLDAGIYTTTVNDLEYSIAAADFDQYKEQMGGSHIVMQPDPGCMPIGSDPDVSESEKPTIRQRIKKAVSDLFHIEQHPEQRIEVRRKRVIERLEERRKRQEVIPLPAAPEHCVAGWQPGNELRNQMQESKDIINDKIWNTRTYPDHFRM